MTHQALFSSKIIKMSSAEILLSSLGINSVFFFSTVDSSRNNSIISEDGVSADELSSLLKNPQNGRSYLDVLPSPRVSPEMWSNVPDVVVNTEDERISGKK